MTFLHINKEGGAKYAFPHSVAALVEEFNIPEETILLGRCSTLLVEQPLLKSWHC